MKNIGRSIPLIGIVVSDFVLTCSIFIVQMAMKWWLLQENATPLLLSIFAMCFLIPMGIGSVVSGLFVNRFGSRRLLILAKLTSLVGTSLCAIMLLADLLTMEILFLITVLTASGVAPAISADLSRVPVFARFAGCRIATFHMASYSSFVLGRIGGLGIAGLSVEWWGASNTVAAAAVLVALALTITLLTFPRDRRSQSDPVTVSTWFSLSRQVIMQESIRRFGIIAVLCLSLLSAISLTLVEVVLPLEIRSFGGVAGTLSLWLIVASGSIIAGAAVYRVFDGYINIYLLMRVLSIVFAVILIITTMSNIFSIKALGICLCISISSFLATGLLVVAQSEVLLKLQSQVISIWYTLEKVLTAACLMVVGVAGLFSPSGYMVILMSLSIIVAMLMQPFILRRIREVFFRY